MKSYLLAIDQGTSSSRVLLFNDQLQVVASEQHQYNQLFPATEWVEQKPQVILDSVLISLQQLFYHRDIRPEQVAGIGICNQRETVVMWHKETGQPLYNAIGWQDGRTRNYCQQLVADGHQQMIQQLTGLPLNPYFSAPKIRWLLDNVPEAQQLADANLICCGTIDSFLLWHLTKQQAFYTDATNASRTMLYDIHRGEWSKSLLNLFNIPRHLLATVTDSTQEFGVLDSSILGCEIPIFAVLGDQQASLVGHGCFSSGMGKSTFGTGTFVMFNTGQKVAEADPTLLTTIGYQLEGVTHYALEGSIFNSGSALKWCRDQLGFSDDYGELLQLAEQAPIDSEVQFIPCFSGLGAPHWQPNCKAQISQLTLADNKQTIMRALCEGCCFQVLEVINTVLERVDLPQRLLSVDGGMVVNEWFCQLLADSVGFSIQRADSTEISARGVAALAGIVAGNFESLTTIAELFDYQHQFVPSENQLMRKKYRQWQQRLQRLKLIN